MGKFVSWFISVIDHNWVVMQRWEKLFCFLVADDPLLSIINCLTVYDIILTIRLSFFQNKHTQKMAPLQDTIITTQDRLHIGE